MATNTTSEAPSQTSGEAAASCTTAVPGKYGNVPITACNSYYNFNPEFAPAVAVCVLFSILTLAHMAEAYMFKKRYCWVLIMGAAWEAIGFGLHTAGAHDQQNAGYATAHNLLFLLSPLWINAFAYMTFARMVHYFLPESRVWKIKGASLAKCFVWADILAFIIQGVGGLMANPGNDSSTMKTGVDVYMGGIAVQEAFVLFFISLMVLFHRQSISLETSIRVRERPWRPLLYALYGVLLAITVRIIFRLVEYSRGMQPSNPVPFHEEYAYALDAFPMMVAILILAVIHPGRYLVGPESEFPKKSRKERKAEKKAKKAEKQAAKAERKAGRHFAKVGELAYNESSERGDSGSWDAYDMSERNQAHV